MKQHSYLLVIAMLVVAVASCGDDPNANNNVDSDSTSEVKTHDSLGDIAADASALDTGTADDFGQPCTSDASCNDGPCVMAANGSVCTKTCTYACPDGWSCMKDPDDDSVSICLPNFPTLCMPCSENAECDVSHSVGGARCIPLDDQGSFCAGSCTDTECPPGFTCRSTADVDGEVSSQCVKDDAYCICSAYAVSAGGRTSCSITNQYGTCEGEKTCMSPGDVTSQGMSPCDADVPAEEICDGEDNDCNATTLDGSFEKKRKKIVIANVGDESVGEFYSVALTNNRQQADTGTKMVHVGPRTRSTIVSKGISAGHSSNSYRGLVQIGPAAKGARNYSQCDSMLIGDQAAANTYPYIRSQQPQAAIEHEASTCRISEDQLFYLQSRGIGFEEAVSMMVSGFCRDVFNQLPMEFAAEADKLLALKLEGSVG